MAKPARSQPPRKKPDGRDVLIAMGKKGTAPKGGGKTKPAKAKGPKRPFLAVVKGWAKAIAIAAVVGGGLGGALVLGGMYRHAVATVENRLQGPVWTVPGRVLSGPIEVWPGLAYTAEELAADLQAAGYARVAKPDKPGDFSVADGAVVVLGKAASGPGWSVKGGETLVELRGGKVASVTPQGRATFAPALLTTVRGPDNENRNPVELERIPKHVRNAVLAMEDARFYEHPGVDAVGIVRALFADLVAGQLEQGGSTLTQQVAKNLFLTHERTARRKFDEALLSFALERRLSKDEILQLYLNEIYLGQSGGSAVCGMDEAARAFFGKPVERVSLGEAATLAGIISSPNPYSPIRHPDKAKERRDVALARMVELGTIDAAAAEAARNAPLEIHASAAGRRAPWAVDLAVERVESELGEGVVVRDGLEIHTAISPPLQRAAEKALAEGMAELVAAHPKLAGVQAALVAVRARDGAIVAMVGGRDYATSPYDRATFARRQVGSTVKPLTMLAAFEQDPALSPATRFEDAPISRISDGKEWLPANYDNLFVGPISLRRAMAASRNVPAVLLAEGVGLPALKNRLHGLGLEGATAYPSVALGGFGATPVELAGAYAVFAGGTFHEPWLTRAATREGVAKYDAPPQKATVRYSERAVWLAADVMRGVMREGTGKNAAKYGVGPGAAGKTGTTDGYVDAWFAGVSGPYAVVVWVGHDRNQPVGLTGSQAALPTWARFVAATGTSDAVPTPPAGVEQAEVCVETDLPPCGDCAETRLEWFTAGQVPDPKCGVLEEAGEALQDAGEAVKTGWQKIGEAFGLGKRRRAEEAERAAEGEAQAPREGEPAPD